MSKKSISICLEKIPRWLEKIFSASSLVPLYSCLSLKIFGRHYQFWSGIIVLGNGRITLLELLAKIFPALPALSSVIFPVHLFSGDGPGSWGCGKENCNVAEHLHLKDLELPLGISGKKGLLKAGKWYLQMWLRSVLFHCCPFKFRFFFTSVGSLKGEPTVVKKNLDIKGHQWKIILPAIWEFFPAG